MHTYRFLSCIKSYFFTTLRLLLGSESYILNKKSYRGPLFRKLVSWQMDLVPCPISVCLAAPAPVWQCWTEEEEIRRGRALVCWRNMASSALSYYHISSEDKALEVWREARGDRCRPR